MDKNVLVWIAGTLILFYQISVKLNMHSAPTEEFSELNCNTNNTVSSGFLYWWWNDNARQLELRQNLHTCVAV